MSSDSHPLALPRPLRLAIVTNIPAPYRVPVYNRIAAQPGISLRVLYAARREPDRQWDLPAFAHEHVFLRERMHVRSGRYIHDNPDVIAELRRYAPDVVLTTGYNPTHLKAWLYALLCRRRHVVMTDGTDRSEAGLSLLHRAVRRLVFAGSQAFVVASDGGERLLRGYGAAAARVHRSPLCANTDADWAPALAPARDIDLLFSGRMVATKNPDFALRVAQAVALRLQRRVSLVLLGHGPLLEGLLSQAPSLAPMVDVHFAGHVPQAEMPHWFLRARVFVFPTRWDPWGVVANEACLAGVPVLVSPHAGAAGELVRDGAGGQVLALEEALWVDAATALLSDPVLHARQAHAARLAVAPYSFENAAAGIIDAARHALSGQAPAPPLSTFRSGR